MEKLTAKIEDWSQRRPLAFALLMTAFMFAIVFAIYNPAYQTNDDVAMSMIASGNGISLNPDEHIVFSHVTIGLVLKFLYTWSPGISWYALYLFAVLFAAQAALLYAMLTWRYNRRHVQLFYLCFATVGFHFIVALQFTTVAFFAVESGAIVALTAICRRADDEAYRPAWMLAYGVGLMVLGSMVRLDSYYAAAAIAIPPALLVLWRAARSGPAKSQLWKPALFVAVVTQALVMGMDYVQTRYYAADPEWGAFMEYNPIRVKFNDYQWIRYNRQTKPVFDRVKWSANDHAMIDHFYFDDPEIYSLDNLRSIEKGFSWAKAKANWRNLGVWWTFLLSDNSLWPIWLLLPIYVWSARNRRQTLVLLCVATATIVGLLFTLMMLKMPPPRVYYPMFAFQLLFALLAIRTGTAPADTGNRPKQLLSGATVSARFFSLHWRAVAIILLAAIGAVFGDYRLYRYSRSAYKTNQALLAAWADVGPRDDELFVCWAHHFPFEAILPLDSPRILGNARMLQLGWTQHSPVNRAMKEHFHITDLVQALYTDPKLYLISADDLNELLTTYAREHQQAELSWERCFTCPQFWMFKLSAAATPGSRGSQPVVDTVNVTNSRMRRMQ